MESVVGPPSPTVLTVLNVDGQTYSAFSPAHPELHETRELAKWLRFLLLLVRTAVTNSPA